MLNPANNASNYGFTHCAWVIFGWITRFFLLITPPTSAPDYHRLSTLVTWTWLPIISARWGGGSKSAKEMMRLLDDETMLSVRVLEYVTCLRHCHNKDALNWIISVCSTLPSLSLMWTLWLGKTISHLKCHWRNSSSSTTKRVVAHYWVHVTLSEYNTLSNEVVIMFQLLRGDYPRDWSTPLRCCLVVAEEECFEMKKVTFYDAILAPHTKLYSWARSSTLWNHAESIEEPQYSHKNHTHTNRERWGN